MRVAVVRNYKGKGVINRFGRPCPEAYGRKSIERVVDALRTNDHTVAVFEGMPPDDGHEVASDLRTASETFPAISETEQAEFTGPPQAQSAAKESALPRMEGYEIEGRLGEGGMGTVWRAVQLSTKREVALKFLGRHRFASKKSRARFEREVSLAAKLTHPNIARVYHSGLHRGVYYYAMELVDGIHLDKYVQQNELSQRQILELMASVSDAIRHAHERGIIHRDLKPSNILVTKDGQPHVVDFGLAKASMKEEDDVTISIDGEVAGTLAYMSPEQAAGRLDKIGEQTDVYSLGVILHQLLTGRFPHDVSGSRYEVIKSIVEEEVESPREYDDSIDSDLESLLLTALAQKPEDRYPSAAVLSQDIKNYLNGEALLARSLSATYRIRKRFRKHAKQIAKTLMLAAVVAAIIVVAYCLVSSERKKRLEAERDKDIADHPGRLTPESEDETGSPQEQVIKSIVSIFQHAWKTANPSQILEAVISDKAYAVAAPNGKNPSEAVIIDKTNTIASLGTSIPPARLKDSYKITSVSVFGPLAYVLATCTWFDEDGNEYAREGVYFLASDETGWKIISAGRASNIRQALNANKGYVQVTREDENAKAAIRALMDKVNRAWKIEDSSLLLQEVLSDKAFAFALKSPDDPSQAAILNKHSFCKSFDRMQQEQQIENQEHTIESIAVFGPVAYEIGVTRNIYPDGTQSHHQSLNFFAKDETGWKMYFSTSADLVREALGLPSDDERTVRKLAEEYVNTFNLHQPFPSYRLSRRPTESHSQMITEKIIE